MAQLKREFFRRPARMTHRFDGDDAPFTSREFDDATPRTLRNRRSPPLEVQAHGEHVWIEPQSPVVTPAGRKTSINGPSPDVPDAIAQPIPAGTKKRKSP